MNITTLNDWGKLKKRYGSNRQYSQRKVISSKIHFHDFIEFLIHLGADISAKPMQDEALRFHLNGEIGIVYTKGSGNLLAHDLGIRYQKSISEPIQNNLHMTYSFDLGVYA